MERRRQEVENLGDAIDRAKKALSAEELKSKNRDYILAWDSLVRYVENSLLLKAIGPDLRAEFEKGVADIRDEEANARFAEIEAAVAAAEPEQIALGEEQNLEFYSLEGRHIRAMYPIGDAGLSHDYARDLVLLGEETIETFLRQAIDPIEEFHLEQTEELPAILPEGIFLEFVFGLENKKKQIELYKDYSGNPDPDVRVFESDATGGIRRYSRDEPLFFSFSKMNPPQFPGRVVHQRRPRGGELALQPQGRESNPGCAARDRRVRGHAPVVRNVGPQRTEVRQLP